MTTELQSIASTPLRKSAKIIKKLDPVIAGVVATPTTCQGDDRTLVTQSSDHHDLEMSREKKERTYLKI